MHLPVATDNCFWLVTIMVIGKYLHLPANYACYWNQSILRWYRNQQFQFSHKIFENIVAQKKKQKQKQVYLLQLSRNINSLVSVGW